MVSVTCRCWVAGMLRVQQEGNHTVKHTFAPRLMYNYSWFSCSFFFMMKLILLCTRVNCYLPFLNNLSGERVIITIWFFMHCAAREGRCREKKWKISSYSHSNPLKRALLPLTAKHFDTSLLKITGKKGWNRVILRGFRKRERFAVIS